MPDWLPVVATIMGALIINGAGYYLARSQRGKNRADAATVLTGSALDLARRYEEEAEELRQEVQELRERVRALEDRLDMVGKENLVLRLGARRLEGQIVSMGSEPVWKISDLKPYTHEG